MDHKVAVREANTGASQLDVVAVAAFVADAKFHAPTMMSASSARPANVPVTASIPSLATMIKLSSMAGANPRAYVERRAPRFTLPWTASWSYWVPAVVPFSSTPKLGPP